MKADKNNSGNYNNLENSTNVSGANKAQGGWGFAADLWSKWVRDYYYDYFSFFLNDIFIIIIIIIVIIYFLVLLSLTSLLFLNHFSYSYQQFTYTLSLSQSYYRYFWISQRHDQANHRRGSRGKKLKLIILSSCFYFILFYFVTKNKTNVTASYPSFFFCNKIK